jgi:hypothetical protein
VRNRDFGDGRRPTQQKKLRTKVAEFGIKKGNNEQTTTTIVSTIVQLVVELVYTNQDAKFRLVGALPPPWSSRRRGF